VKLAICIPSYGDTKAKFTQSLASMLVHTAQADLRDENDQPIELQIETFIVSSSMLTEGRHRLVAEALTWEADYMLWLDADHVFPHDAFVRLWSHNLPIVGANYARRCTPTAPTAAYYEEGNPVAKQLYTTKELADAGKVEPCAHLGFGLCLMNMQIFDALQAHAEEHGDGNFLPLFKFEPTEDKVGMIGEDVFFFRKCRDAGIVPFVDHALSWNVGHISEVIMTNAHAVSQREKWAEVRKKRGDKFDAKAAEIEQRAESEVVA
jgi:hypothetical protein